MFGRIQRIHFVGIGGIGMSGIAELLHNQGYRVTGSDLRPDGPTGERLRRLGIEIRQGHAPEHVGDADVVVYSSAVRPDNPELAAAERRKIPVIRRAEMLAELMRMKQGIAVAGTHGKTTTTSLIAHVLTTVGRDPTAVIGGRVLSLAGDATGSRLGQGPWLVAEADESDGTFLDLFPVIAVVTNVDPEHLDHFGSYEALRDAFARFANRVPFWGLAVLCLDHPGVQALLPSVRRRITTYGLSSQADLSASELTADGWGMRFAVNHRSKLLGSVRLRLPGRHNVANALATLAVTLELDVDFREAADALDEFLGIERRFQNRGEVAGIRVVDDYAHHPAEVRATLEAARSLHRGRIVAVFQPHRYTRTRDLLEEFASAFHEADCLRVTELYPAGEEPIPGIGSEALVGAIRDRGHRDAAHVGDLDEALPALLADLRPGDLVLTLGAGSISSLGPRLLEALRAEGRR